MLFRFDLGLRRVCMERLPLRSVTESLELPSVAVGTSATNVRGQRVFIRIPPGIPPASYQRRHQDCTARSQRKTQRSMAKIQKNVVGFRPADYWYGGRCCRPQAHPWPRVAHVAQAWIDLLHVSQYS